MILEKWNWSQVWTAVAHMKDYDDEMEAAQKQATEEAELKAKQRKR